MTSERLRAYVIDAVERDLPALTVELAGHYLNACPDDWSVLLLYAEALTEFGRYDEARQILERALRLAPPTEPSRHAATLRLFGGLHAAAGDRAAAERSYRAAIATAPEDASAYIYLGGLLARAGRLAEAEQLHERATGCASGEIGEAWLNLALVRRARGDYAGALAGLRAALALDPAHAPAQEALVDIEAVLFEFPALDA